MDRPRTMALPVAMSHGDQQRLRDATDAGTAIADHLERHPGHLLDISVSTGIWKYYDARESSRWPCKPQDDKRLESAVVNAWKAISADPDHHGLSPVSIRSFLSDMVVSPSQGNGSSSINPWVAKTICAHDPSLVVTHVRQMVSTAAGFADTQGVLKTRERIRTMPADQVIPCMDVCLQAMVDAQATPRGMSQSHRQNVSGIMAVLSARHDVSWSGYAHVADDPTMIPVVRRQMAFVNGLPLPTLDACVASSRFMADIIAHPERHRAVLHAPAQMPGSRYAPPAPISQYLTDGVSLAVEIFRQATPDDAWVETIRQRLDTGLNDDLTALMLAQAPSSASPLLQRAMTMPKSKGWVDAVTGDADIIRLRAVSAAVQRGDPDIWHDGITGIPAILAPDAGLHILRGVAGFMSTARAASHLSQLCEQVAHHGATMAERQAGLIMAWLVMPSTDQRKAPTSSAIGLACRLRLLAPHPDAYNLCIQAAMAATCADVGSVNRGKTILAVISDGDGSQES